MFPMRQLGSTFYFLICVNCQTTQRRRRKKGSTHTHQNNPIESSILRLFKLFFVAWGGRRLLVSLSRYPIEEESQSNSTIRKGKHLLWCRGSNNRIATSVTTNDRPIHCNPCTHSPPSSLFSTVWVVDKRRGEVVVYLV